MEYFTFLMLDKIFKTKQFAKRPQSTAFRVFARVEAGLSQHRRSTSWHRKTLQRY